MAFRMSSVFFKGERVKPFLLNKDDTPYQACSGSNILKSKDPKKIIAGVRTQDGKVHKVDYFSLLKKSKKFKKSLNLIRQLPSVSNPCPDKSILEQINHILDIAHENNPGIKEKNEVLNMVYNFNNKPSICNNINKSESRLATLLNSWADFCKDRDPELCQKAKEVDMLTRTIVFEAHPLGSLDNKDVSDPYTLDQQEFPTSRCERRYIAMTLRNRGNKKENKVQSQKPIGTKIRKGKKKGKIKKINISQLSKHSPYFTDGLSERMYNIWFNSHIRKSYISACFSKGTVLPEGTSELEAKGYYLFQHSFLTSLTDTYDTLYKPDTMNSKVDFINSVSGKAEDIQNEIAHYYHPRAMPKCYFSQDKKNSWITRSNAVGLVACRDIQGPGSKKTKDCALLKNEPHRLNTKTGEVRFVQRDQKESGIFKYRWNKDDSIWKVQRLIHSKDNKRFYKRKSSPAGKNHFISDIKKSRYCESFDGKSPIGNKAPSWALKKNKPRYYNIRCTFDDGSQASLGGHKDPRIIPVYVKK